MGSSPAEPGHQPHEAPQHEVVIAAPFAIGRFEVTFAEWNVCVRDGGCRHIPDDAGWGGERMPVINVSWIDITEQYLPWLSRKSGQPYRLPSEAEWEYALRASPDRGGEVALSTADLTAARCSLANAADGIGRQTATSPTAIFCSDSYPNTAPVGSFKPNPWGLYDMTGNVWEWVADCWNATYDKAPTDGSAWTTGACELRALRGGSWASDADKLGPADRGWSRPEARNASIGFRVARNR
jgi:formylglycine-generating enzyme required for sulfatase activity